MMNKDIEINETKAIEMYNQILLAEGTNVKTQLQDDVMMAKKIANYIFNESKKIVSAKNKEDLT